MMMILSGDPPRSRVLSILLVVIIAALAVAPFVFPGAKAMNVATKICIFAALVGFSSNTVAVAEAPPFDRRVNVGLHHLALGVPEQALVQLIRVFAETTITRQGRWLSLAISETPSWTIGCSSTSIRVIRRRRGCAVSLNVAAPGIPGAASPPPRGSAIGSRPGATASTVNDFDIPFLRPSAA